MATTTGVHAGFIWNIGDQGAIYFTDDHGSADPFNNPKFKKAFEKADILAFSLLKSEKPKFEKLKDLEKTLAPLTEGYITDAEIADLNQKLEKVPPHPLFSDKKFEKSETPREQFIQQVFLYFLSLAFPHKKEEYFLHNILEQKAEESGKSCISLSLKGAIENYLLGFFTTLVKSPGFPIFIQEMLLTEQGNAEMKQHYEAKGKSWDVGANGTYEKLKPVSEETGKKMDEALQKRHGSVDMKPCCEEMDQLEATLLHATTNSVETMLSVGAKTLFIQDSSQMDKLFLALAKRNISVQGPLKEDIKPRGFLWEIRKADKVAGYFFGSVHLTPDWILKNFNSKTLEAFNYCDALGVELDITNEKHISALTEEKFEIPEEKKQLIAEILLEGFKDLGIEEKDLEPTKGLELLIKKIMAQYGTESGIDLKFIEMAKKKNMPIFDLESIQTHKDFLTLMDKEQKTHIAVTENRSPLDIYKEVKADYERTVCQFYPAMLESGLPEALEIRWEKDPEEMKQAMNARNMEMALSTHKLILEGKTPFSIVGCMHFAGPMGMQKLMENMGYKVTQIICEEPRSI